MTTIPNDDHFQDRVVHLTYKVIHEFNPEEDGEISLKKGELVTVLARDEGFNDGWWRGRNARGDEGLFPSNFITSQPLPPPRTKNKTNAQLPLGKQVAQKLFIPNNSTHSIAADSAADTVVVANNNFSSSIPVLNDATNSLEISPNSLYTQSTTLLDDTAPSSPSKSAATTGPSTLLIDQWTVNDVCMWLRHLGYGKYMQLFREHDIDGHALVSKYMDAGTLKDIGMASLERRIRLLGHISMLRKKHQKQLFDEMSNVSIIMDTGAYDETENEAARTPDIRPIDVPWPTPPSPATDVFPPLISPNFNSTNDSKENVNLHMDEDDVYGERTHGDILAAIEENSVVQASVKPLRNFSFSRSTRPSFSRQLVNVSEPPKAQSELIPVPPRKKRSSSLTSNRVDFKSQLHPDIKTLSDVLNMPVSKAGNALATNNPSKCLHSGFLWKRGGHAHWSWKRRYFVIKDYILWYFQSDADDAPALGMVCLPSYSVALDKDCDAQLGRFTFVLKHQNARTYYFLAESLTDMSTWMNALTRACLLMEDSYQPSPSSLFQASPMVEVPKAVDSEREDVKIDYEVVSSRPQSMFDYDLNLEMLRNSPVFVKRERHILEQIPQPNVENLSVNPEQIKARGRNASISEPPSRVDMSSLPITVETPSNESPVIEDITGRKKFPDRRQGVVAPFNYLGGVFPLPKSPQISKPVSPEEIDQQKFDENLVNISDSPSVTSPSVVSKSDLLARVQKYGYNPLQSRR